MVICDLGWLAIRPPGMHPGDIRRDPGLHRAHRSPWYIHQGGRPGDLRQEPWAEGQTTMGSGQGTVGKENGAVPPRGVSPAACTRYTHRGGDTKQGHGTRDKGLGTRDMRQMMRRELSWSVSCAACPRYSGVERSGSIARRVLLDIVPCTLQSAVRIAEYVHIALYRIKDLP